MSEGESCPFILAVREMAGRELRGILPLGRVRERVGPLQLSTIRSLSLHRHDLTTVVAEEEWRGEVDRVLAEELSRRAERGDQVRVRGIPESVSLLRALGEGWLTELPSPLRVADLTGASSWQDVIVDGKQRRELLRARRNLSREYASEVQWSCNAAEARRDFRIFTELHRVQLAERARDNHFVGHRVLNPLEAHFAAWVEQGNADIGILRAGEVPIAAYLLMHTGRLTWAYRTTFALEWGRFAPGALLLAAAVDRAIARGSVRYDFGWGDQKYKRHWSTVVDSTIQLSAQSRWRRLPFRVLPRLGVPVQQVCGRK